MALALVLFPTDHGACLGGDLDGVVGRIIVVDIDRRMGQSGAEIGDHLGDRFFFVVAGHENRDAGALDGTGFGFCAKDRFHGRHPPFRPPAWVSG